MTERRGLDAKERADVKARRAVRAPVLYEITRQSGVEELERPVVSLWWSGIAAGLAISASIYCEGLFRLHLPDAAWRPLVENLGYTVGFLIVIMSRFQLFTEQTVTAILPLLSDWTRRNLWRTARLWIVVLVANLAGAFAAAAFGAYSPGTGSEKLAAFLALSQHFADRTFVELLVQGIPAGFLMAALAWMMPNSEGSKFWVIIVITYVIALGDFTHVVAGSVEVFLLLLAGNIGIAQAFGGLIFPALVGNILGGAVLFSVIAYAQVSEEM